MTTPRKKNGLLVFPYGPNLTIDEVERRVMDHREIAQELLDQEYRNPNGPRYSLIQWLKRHRLHNATTRVIHKP